MKMNIFIKQLSTILVILSCITTSFANADRSNDYDDANMPPIILQDETNLLAQQFSPNPFGNEDPLELIKKGTFSLTSVYIPPNYDSPHDAPKDVLSKVVGTFCHVDHSLQQDVARGGPSKHPTYTDLMSKSQHCIEHSVTLPLYDVISACHKFDKQQQQQQGESSQTETIKEMNLGGFIYHEPKSGSSVITNSILAASSPRSSRVVSEINIIDDIFYECRYHREHRQCNLKEHLQLLKDVMYLLTRTNSPDESKLYVKFSPQATTYLDFITQVFPKTKWIYVHRDANVVLSKMHSQAHTKRSCAIKAKRNPHKGLKNFVSSVVNKDLQDLSSEEICSATLANYMSIARNEIAKNPTPGIGRIVDYDTEIRNSNVDGIYNILEFFGVVSDSSSANIESTKSLILNETKQKSNAGGSMQNEWVQDDEIIHVTNEITEANEMFFN